MKKIFFLLTAVMVSMAAMAQTLNVVTGDVTYAIPSAQAGDMTYSSGTSLTILGKTFATGEITRMYVDNSTVEDNTVSVTFDGTTAKVVVAGNVAQYVTPTVDGAHVSIVQASTVDDSTCGEITYSLSGSSTDGGFKLEGSYKATIELRGVSLTNPSGAALDIQDGKRIALSVKKDTENSLTDGSDGSQKGCIVCKGHLELKGKGSLTVAGNTAHGIYAKEYVEMKNCTVSVTKAVKDGVNCNQYFLLESGSLTISGVGDDGVQVSFKDDTDREAEDTGSITISGGTINVAVTAAAAKGLKADGDVTVTGGTITVTTSGGGTWDSDDVKTKASAGISADGKVLIEGGTFSLTSTGSGGKGISCDSTFTVNGGEITIKTSGGLFAYVNGTAYDNYTGNVDRLASDYKSSAKGIKVDGKVTINGGTINVTTTGYNSEGIESKDSLVINGGTIVAYTYDDAINSSSHMIINGGTITAVASNNDGLDANGNLYINGGTIMAFGATSPECGIDANEEEGYSVIFTGGTLLAVGGGNSVPSTSASTQPYVSGNGSLSAGNTVTLKNGSDTLATFTVPTGYNSSSSGGGGGGNRPGGGPGGSGSGSSVLVTCPGLTSGSSYTLTCGSSSSTVSARLTGSGGGRW